MTSSSSQRSVVVLVGLPGAGKSSAGAGLAKALGWDFVDLDAAIERRAGTGVAQIFAERGEAAFRAMERDATRGLSQRERVVVAAGGGWMANREAVDLVRLRACCIYLRVSPAIALKRMGTSISERPLLLGDDPLRSLTDLLERRRLAYEEADMVLDVEGLELQEVISQLLVSSRECELLVREGRNSTTARGEND